MLAKHEFRQGRFGKDNVRQGVAPLHDDEADAAVVVEETTLADAIGGGTKCGEQETCLQCRWVVNAPARDAALATTLTRIRGRVDRVIAQLLRGNESGLQSLTQRCCKRTNAAP